MAKHSTNPMEALMDAFDSPNVVNAVNKSLDSSEVSRNLSGESIFSEESVGAVLPMAYQSDSNPATLPAPAGNPGYERNGRIELSYSQDLSFSEINPEEFVAQVCYPYGCYYLDSVLP